MLNLYEILAVVALIAVVLMCFAGFLVLLRRQSVDGLHLEVQKIGTALSDVEQRLQTLKSVEFEEIPSLKRRIGDVEAAQESFEGRFRRLRNTVHGRRGGRPKSRSGQNVESSAEDDSADEGSLLDRLLPLPDESESVDQSGNDLEPVSFVRSRRWRN